MNRLFKAGLWIAIALAGAWAYVVLATRRGEGVNSATIIVAALSTYAIGYRFYSKWIATCLLMLEDRRATPCEIHEDGRDYVRTHKWIVFGHHFAAISGPGPLVGPVLASQFGYLPGTLWILVGVVLGGAVQDFVILVASMRRDGRSLGQMVRDEVSPVAGWVGMAAILAIMTILLAVLALVVVNALAESPWGVFTVGLTIPIALVMGIYLRYGRVGRVGEVTVLGVVLLLAAVWGGRFAHENPALHGALTRGREPLAWALLVYAFAASALPVWLLLAPRDYLSTFMKLGTIVALAMGVLLVLPDLRMPAFSRYLDGTGPVVAGKLFPFCFITIACGAISGFHTLIASGITPKIITRESHARLVGYGAMCLESMVAVMALIAACTLEPGIYLGMNVASPGPTPELRAAATVARVKADGFEVSLRQMDALARSVGEVTLFGKTGGAATLAVGMAQIFSNVTRGRWLDLWYHFAIMFEALFILTTLDAGTRVGRYLIQDALGGLWRPLGDVKSVAAGLLASGLMVGAWGFFLIQGVRDPDGGVKALWPLFGMANQLLASIALCLATTLILKMNLLPTPGREGSGSMAALRRALVTGIPLVWLLTVTLTAGVEKVFHPEPRIGFLAAAHVLDGKASTLSAEISKVASGGAGDAAALQKALKDNRRLAFNHRVDALAALVFMTLVLVILGLSVREWWRLIRGTKPPQMSETEPVCLPGTALSEGRGSRWLGLATLGMGLVREWNGHAAVERELARTEIVTCACGTVSLSGSTAHPTIQVSLGLGRLDDAAKRSAMDRVQARQYHGINRCC